MAEDNAPTGGFSDPFKDLFNGNPTLGANPTQGPVTSNSAPSSGNSGTDSSASSDGGGVSSDAGSASGSDAADSGTSASSQSPSSSAASPSSSANSGISSSASGSNTSGMGSEGGGSWGDDMSITGGAAPDGRTSYSDPASGGLSSDTGPIGGLDGITSASDRMPVSLSNSASSVADPLSGLRSALGIGAPAPDMTGTNAEYNPFSGAVGPALTDPLASVPAATWGGLGPAQPDDMINMGSPYQNPDRVPVQSLSDGLLAPKISDRVPPTEGFVNASARRAPTGTEDDFLNEIVPGFGGPPVASNIPGAPEYDPLQDMQPSDVDQSIVAQNDLGNFNQTQVAKNGPTPAGWDTMTAAQAYDPLDEIKQALGIGAAPPDSFAEIPRPQDPLQAIKTALDIPGANVNLPGGNSRFQGKEWRPLTGSLSVPVPQQDLPVDPRVGLPNTGLPAQQAIAQPASAPPSGKDPERLVSIPQQDGTTITAPVSKDLLSQLPDDLAATLGKFLGGYANDETYQEGEQSAGNYSQYDTPAGNTAAYPSQGTVDPNSTEYVSAPETVPPQGEVQTADINQPMPEGDYPPNIDQSPTQGKAGNVAFSQKPKAPSTTTGNILETIVDLITRGTKGEDAKNDYNDYASMTPEEKQAWADRRAAEQQMADRQDGGNARNDAQQVENPDKAKIDELEAEIAALNAIIQARKAAKRSGKQRDLIMRNYS